MSRHLHRLDSFPTRRSSDLVLDGDELAQLFLDARRGAERDAKTSSGLDAFDHRPGSELLPTLALGRQIRRCERARDRRAVAVRSEEHTSELQSLTNLVCRLL